ncbi:hypothetical protein [Puia dinghuensis]|uniref:Uncharacterized protein n=1 Tax=Puia dinghuensis TaxID=1792502 RepID=A0A8J2UBN7_9BACT|nr:hypothetical protein [Puia dinghuensis]GGA93331.1 hypothetical protein GCM10011511_15920 [Puia dinghuensis]
MSQIPTREEIEVMVALGQMFILRVSEGEERVYNVQPAEEGLRPLIEAMDDTLQVKVIVNTRGQFNPAINGFNFDEANATLGFLLRPGAKPAEVEIFFKRIMVEFNDRESPAMMRFWKDFIDVHEYFYYVEVLRCNCEEDPVVRKSDIDSAVNVLAERITSSTDMFGAREANGQASA